MIYTVPGNEHRAHKRTPCPQATLMKSVYNWSETFTPVASWRSLHKGTDIGLAVGLRTVRHIEIAFGQVVRPCIHTYVYTYTYIHINVPYLLFKR